MDRLNAILKAITFAVYIAVGVMVFLFAQRGYHYEKPIGDGAVAAVATVNAGCVDNGHQVVCGTLSSVGQTTKNFGIVAAQTAEQAKLNGQLFQTATQGLNTMLSTVNGRLPATFDRVDSSLTNIDAATVKIPPLIDAATDQLNGLAPLETALTKLVSDTDTRTGTTFADLKVTESHIDTLLTQFGPLIANATGVTGNLEASTADFQTRFHAVLFPPACATFWCRLSRLWPFIKDAASMGEATYWIEQLFQNTKP